MDPRPFVAPWSRRLAAVVIDNLLMSAMSLLVGLQHASRTAGDLRLIAELAVVLCYFGYLNGVIGQTIGKRLLGIRCVDADTGGPIGFGRGVARYAIVAVLGLALVVPELVDGLSALWDVRRQTWHDKAVRSLVVPAA